MSGVHRAVHLAARVVYSRAQVAVALGVSHRESERLLPATGADSFTLAKGGQPAWTFRGLPTVVRDRLYDVAALQHRDIRAVLEGPVRRWLTAGELVRLDIFQFNLAGALRSRLIRALEGCNELPLFGEELVAEVARRAYQERPDLAVEIAPRLLRALIRRTIRRDANEHLWIRLDLCRPWSKSDLAARVF